MCSKNVKIHEDPIKSDDGPDPTLGLKTAHARNINFL
jgi:hypothetical protein